MQKKPKLNKLGSNQWTKTKNQVRGAVRQIARDLVELYAARQQENGYQYEPDTVWQKEFEEMFPFEETDDQLQAIADTKQDMESKKNHGPPDLRRRWIRKDGNCDPGCI